MKTPLHQLELQLGHHHPWNNEEKFVCKSTLHSYSQFPYLTCVPASTDVSGGSFKDVKDAATSHGGIILHDLWILVKLIAVKIVTLLKVISSSIYHPEVRV